MPSRGRPRPFRVVQHRRSTHPWSWLILLVREHDWITRHAILEGLKHSRFHIWKQVIARLGPEEHLEGDDKAYKMPRDSGIVIPLPDAPRRKLRQTKLNEYFFKRR